MSDDFHILAVRLGKSAAQIIERRVRILRRISADEEKRRLQRLRWQNVEGIIEINFVARQNQRGALAVRRLWSLDDACLPRGHIDIEFGRLGWSSCEIVPLHLKLLPLCLRGIAHPHPDGRLVFILLDFFGFGEPLQPGIPELMRRDPV